VAHALPSTAASSPTPALALSMLIASLGVSIVTVALPSLARDLSASVSGVQWVVVAYLLAATVSIVTVGRLGDLYGRRRVLLTGLCGFAAGAALAAIAPSLWLLVAARALQGLGGAILMALPIAVARDTVAPERVGAAMGLLGTMSALGTALGPSAGGILIAAFGWRAAFVSLAVLATATLCLAAMTLPVTAERRTPGALGLASTATLALALTACALLAQGADAPIAPAVAGLLAVGGLILFLAVERRAASPLLPLALLRVPTVAAAIAMNVLVTTVMMATLVVGPFFLTFALGLGEAAVGLTMAVGPAAAALAGVPAGRLADRLGAPRILKAGLLTMIAALCAFALLPTLIGVAGYISALIALTPGFQLFLAANNTVVMMAAPERERGVLSGLLGLSRNLGFMTGASAMATLFAAALGSEPVTTAAASAVGFAFSVTFVAAAGLIALALALTFVGGQAAAAR